MDDYISRKAAINALCKAVHKDDGIIPCENQTTSCLWSGTRVCDYAREIDALPSADVVDVVRCRDCKYFEQDGPYDGWCHGWSGMIVDDGFCSFGERKGGDTDG